jgi:hypothetical protein
MFEQSHFKVATLLGVCDVFLAIEIEVPTIAAYIPGEAFTEILQKILLYIIRLMSVLKAYVSGHHAAELSGILKGL